MLGRTVPVARPQAVLLRNQHAHRLITPGGQCVELLGVGVPQWAHRWTYRLGEVRQDLGVQLIGLGETGPWLWRNRTPGGD